MQGSVNPLWGGTERRVHLSRLNISRKGLLPVFKNPILWPSYCLALNVFWTDIVWSILKCSFVIFSRVSGVLLKPKRIPFLGWCHEGYGGVAPQAEHDVMRRGLGVHHRRFKLMHFNGLIITKNHLTKWKIVKNNSWNNFSDSPKTLF